jgi:excinuclease ABC subunit C
MPTANAMLETLRTLPEHPGVYQYLDAKGRLLYVGKAKNLRHRVKSYWRFTPELHPNPTLGPRITKMLHEAVRIEYLLAPTESDALILENALIKQLKPRYNILLRDDKTYPYIYIDLSEDFPRFELTRKVVRGTKIRYYGPFPNGGRALLDALYDLFPLVQKKSGLHGGKACLFHQIGKCPAPCEGKITPEAYHETLAQASAMIHKRTGLLARLRERMMELAEHERYEEATKLRDRIEAIEGLQTHSDIDLATTDDFDVFAIEANQERGVVVRMFLRHGRIISAAHSFFGHTDLFDPTEAYRQALLDFYTEELPMSPATILLADPIEDKQELAHTLTQKMGKTIHLHTPQRGAKKRLTDLARTNAQELLRRQNTSVSIERTLAELLKLDAPPWRTEVFDNSHMMGQATVGAMVVWHEGKWDKSSYRRYALEARDEYAQMREMLTRRIARFDQDPPPDLWLLDGGEALRRLAETLLDEAGVALDVVAIAKEKLDAKAHRAKGAARDLIYTAHGILTLAPTDARLQWCQRLRDEAHRFAITYHQNTKRKNDTQIALLAQKGIGPATVQKLIDFFGTFEAIGNATQEELTAVIGKKMAIRIANRDEKETIDIKK